MRTGGDEGRIRRMIIFAAMLLSAVIIFIDVVSFRRYRESLIRTEQSQLLTMARTIGTSLEKYIGQELDKLDLCLRGAEADGSIQAGDIRKIAENILTLSDSLYRGCVCTRNAAGSAGGTVLFTLGEIPDFSVSCAENASDGAGILGKYLADTGWYELLIGKRIWIGDESMVVIFAMDLNKVYQDIVFPVKIGRGGYSVVKDRDLAIIMHHAKNQIGMDALYDRETVYPQLDLRSLKSWLEMQMKQPEGTGLLDSYVWDDPELRPIRRIVAYTTVRMQKEQWIVNSTLPYSELSAPLGQMILIMAVLAVVYLFAMTLAAGAFTKMLARGEAQNREITYLRKINRSMELIARQNEEIRHYQRLESIGLMSAHIAHEFNNYLTPVMLYGEMLEGDEGITEDGRIMVREMMKSVGQAAKLSRELLDFSRMDAGGRFQPVNLSEDVEEAVSVIRQLVPAKISFQAELDGEPAWLMGRQGMMQHILMNLCKNAFQAMEDTERKELVVSYRISEGMAELCVKDSGCGIRDDVRKNIFEPFYTTKGSGQGTGLGLSAVRSLAEQAGGSIEVESGPEQGTAFRLRFPVVPREEDVLKRKTGGQIKKCLCVCRRVPELAPWRLFLDGQPGKLEYSNSEPAAVIRMLEEDTDFDMLIVQQELSSMSGLEFARIIRTKDSRISIVILAEKTDSPMQWNLENHIIDEIRLPDKG